MARRADHTPEQLRRLALNQGLEIIDKKGAAALTARKLAAAIGYTPGTLYHVFGSLDAYLLHLAMHAATMWRDELAPKLDSTRKNKIDFLAHAYIEFAMRHKNRWQLIFTHVPAPKTDLPAEYIECMSGLLKMIDNALIDIEKNALKRHRLAKTLWAAMHGICSLEHSRMLAHSSGSSAEELTNELLALVGTKSKSGL